MQLLFSFIFFISYLPSSVERTAVEDYDQKNSQVITGIVHVDAIGPIAIEHLKKDFSIFWWVENNKEILIHAPLNSFLEIAKEFNCEILNHSFPIQNLAFAKLGTQDITLKDLKILTRSGAFAVVLAPDAVLENLKNKTIQPESHSKTKFWPFQPNTVLVKLSSNKRTLQKTSNRSFQNLVDNVDGARWFSDIETLASFNRYTHNSGNIDARDWLVTQFEALPGLTVSTEAFLVGSTTTYNVMAILPGTTRPDDWYIVGGHFDSTSENTSSSAPGAEDNASGTAGLLEMARIFTAQPPDATIIFICFSGEEQGLNGSEFHVTQLQNTGTQGNVKAVINMDMIGYTGDPELDCLLESRAFASNLIQELEQAAADYTTLVISTTTSASGSDHVPYLNAGIPAILTIENDWNSYPDYHRTTDLPTNITIGMGEETIKMNVAALAEMAFSRANLQYDQTLLINPGANGVADPGESLQLNFQISNSGQLESNSMNCVLTSSNPLVSVVQGISDFPNIQPGTSQLNFTPFEILLDPSLPCGASVLLNLEISYNDGQVRTIQIETALKTGTVLGAAGTVSPGLAIPDNNVTGITSTIIMAGTGGQVSTSFNIDINITHTYIGDLSIDLVSPNNTTVRLWNKSGGSTDNLVGNFPNNLAPSGNMSDFLGEPLDGTWALHIVDSGLNDLGILHSWGLKDIQGYECDPVGCNLNLTLNSLNGVPPLVPCAGDEFTVESTLTGNSGSESYLWEIESGNAAFQGSINLSSATVRLFSNTSLKCTVTDSSCTDNSSFNLSVTKTSITGDDYIRLEDLNLLIDTYWKTNINNIEFDSNSDGHIDILDLVDFAQCL